MASQFRPFLLSNVRILFLLVNVAYQILPLWLMYTTHQIWPIFITIGFFYGFVPLFDWIHGDTKLQFGTEGGEGFFRTMLFVQAFCHFAISIAAIFVAASGVVPLPGAILAVVVTGMLNVQCPVVAHEFGHKLGRINRTMSNFVCAIVGMGYFMPQHCRGHHVQVATPEDCASARFGDTSYGFVIKSFPAEVRGGFFHEGERLRRRGISFWSFENDVLVSYGMSVVIAAALVAWLGWIALPFVLLHHFAAWFTLMLNDYIQHYGLMREMLPNGRREPASPQHSWNTDTPLCNLLVFNVQRHSHHHAQPMLAYQHLRDIKGTPRLPTGYFGMMIVALIPPLWFRVMDPRVVQAARGRRDLVNVGRYGNFRLRRLLEDYAATRPQAAPAGAVPAYA